MKKNSFISKVFPFLFFHWHSINRNWCFRNIPCGERHRSGCLEVQRCLRLLEMTWSQTHGHPRADLVSLWCRSGSHMSECGALWKGLGENALIWRRVILNICNWVHYPKIMEKSFEIVPQLKLTMKIRRILESMNISCRLYTYYIIYFIKCILLDSYLVIWFV